MTLTNYQVLPEAILVGYRGSIAHGMYVPSTDPKSVDDVDLMGITVPGPEYYFGLQSWGSRGTKEVWEEPYDVVYYEIKKMFGLLLQGNPNVLSFVWMKPEDYLVCTPLGRRIVENREVFTGKHVYHAFAGYASAQLQKMESRDPAELREYIAVTNELKYRGMHPNHKGERFPRPYTLPFPNAINEATDGEDLAGMNGANDRAVRAEGGEVYNAWNTSTENLLARLKHYQKKGENLGYLGDKRKKLVLEHGYDCKNAAHCIRLLKMCCEFLVTGEMRVNRQEVGDAEYLLNIKRGAFRLEVIKDAAEEYFTLAKEAYERSSLPEEPDRAAAERLLVEIVKEKLG